MVLVGSCGLVVGRTMAANGHTDPAWTKDTDFQTALVLGTILIVLAIWNLWRANDRKLWVIALLALGGVLDALTRIGRDDPPGGGGGAGVGLERAGLFLMVAAGVVVILGLIWSGMLAAKKGDRRA